MPYDPTKFAELDRMLAESKRTGIKVVVVAAPQVLGDTYEELIINLDKLAAHDLQLAIVSPTERQGASRN